MILRRSSACLITFFGCFAAAEGDVTTAGNAFFEQRIRPVLVENCFECHSASAAEVHGGLMLDNRAATARGGESGPVILSGDPEMSRLIRAIRYLDDSFQMPPDGKLTDDVIADFEQWVTMGAPDPRDGPVPPSQGSIEARARDHWAFQLPVKLPRPDVQRGDWPRTETDYFVLARLEQHEIEPSPDADPQALMRRLHYDLTGLPPSFAELQSFAADPSDQAFRQRVDRLLASKHFGERWARHWLDVARFGDTKGYVFQKDRNYPHAYKYRDWVISALNDDLPFTQFLRLQIAADHFVGDEDRADLAALGYLTLGRRFIQNKQDIIDDRIDVVFRGMMGLTVSCARCHDHKYDPVPTGDYYSQYGVFNSSREQQDDDLPLRLVDSDQPADAHVLLRGQRRNRGALAPRQFLSFFAGAQAKVPAGGSGRRELADAITNRSNPLTHRVFANRVWRHLFGEGIVSTPSDFGLRSEPPLHPDVLDHLALMLQETDSVKALIRSIVLSSVYRQQSAVRPDAAERDPENRLLWRANRRRLDFEAMRDSLLAVSGRLDRTVGGESVDITGGSPIPRRTIYAFIDRQNLPGLFRTFDFASPDTHSPQRPETTVPQQALYLLNNPFVQRVAEDVTERIGTHDDSTSQIGRLYHIVLAREPTSEELEWGNQFLAATADESLDDASPSLQPLNAWGRYAQALLLTNEFMFLD
jgi:hypothetical protein